jgi:predicted nucleotidyltransferase
MRLDPSAVAAIREETLALDPAAEVYLHGSRVDDTARGGDVDLLVVSDSIEFRLMMKLRRAILDRIGWQQLDLTVRRRDELDEPFAAVCLSSAVRL